MSKKIVIIGGVAGGMSAATRLRRLMEDAEIIIFEKGPYVSFANCGLPYYVSGEISDRNELMVQTPEKLKARFNLDVRPYHEVIGVNPDQKTVKVVHDGKEFDETYDRLILAPGAKPFVPPIKGIEEAKNAFSLRNIPDLDQIMEHIDTNEVKEAVVIGAGFIGLEMAENLKHKGMSVTVVEMAPHVLPPFDEEMAKFVEAEMKANGINILTGVSASEFGHQGKEIILSNGEKISSDLTILSVGVSPNTDFLQGSGIELGMKNGIIVDENYQTNISDIYAVGDAMITQQQITQSEALIALASPANRQGRQVADVIAGRPSKNRGSIGTAIVRVFDKQAASTGLSERQVKMMGLKHQVVHTSGKDHAGYFPGATQIVLKLIFNPDNGKIYGAQGFGEKGVDKRIDILATAIKAGLTVADLIELEFTYAPPFGAAKDPVNMIGYAALNLMEGLSENVQWHELTEQLDKGLQLLDVRDHDEVATSRKFKRAIQIPLNELRQEMNQLDKNQTYIVSCAGGQRSYIAERILKQHGYKAINLDGSYALYSMTDGEELEDVSNN